MTDISSAFLTHASEILGDTQTGLTSSEIAKHCSSFATEYMIEIPNPSVPFSDSVPNKRTALLENIKRFEPDQQYHLIKELSSVLIRRGHNVEEARKLKIRLISQYSHLDNEDLSQELDFTLLEQTRHWLEGYDDSLALYEEALQKYKHGEFNRNLLDDLRLALEKLLRSVLGNAKSLENQFSNLGTYLKKRGGSAELRNMFVTLIQYFATYQNSYVKHNDAVIEEEVEFVIELTSSFMKYLVRISSSGDLS